MKKYIVNVDLGEIGYVIEASSKEDAAKIATRKASGFIGANKDFCSIQFQKVVRIDGKVYESPLPMVRVDTCPYEQQE
jgi:hypothetical protein